MASPLTPRQMLDRFMDREKRTPRMVEKTFGWYGVSWTEGEFEMGWDAGLEFSAADDRVHGGALATLVDTAMGWATITLLADDEWPATSNLQVQYLRQTGPALLIAKGTVVRRTRSVAFCEGEVTDPAGQVIIRAQATMAIAKRPSS